MKELDNFKKFLNEGKEETNEIFGMGRKNRSKKGEMVLDFSAFLNELMDEEVISPQLYRKLSSGVAELYSNVMDAEPGEVQKTYDYEPFVDDGLDENDATLDEIINEAKPNLKKALPTIAARNVERNNLINADIEDMMDMVGGAGKGEGSEEAQILFKASNASAELEGALTDLQMYFEDDLGEGKEEEE